MDSTNVKIFYDGDKIEKYHAHANVVGFTMNSTFIKQSGAKSWKEFYEANTSFIGSRPISLQVTNDDEIEEQARQLHSFGSNIYVKVPVLNSKGESNLAVIHRLLGDGIKVNITCIFTEKQVNDVFSSLGSHGTPCIVSIFSGSISDTGVDPTETVRLASRLAKSYSNVEILWAGVKDNLVFSKCAETGCHIVTVPDTVMDRISRIGLDLHKMSIDKVVLFNNDAKGVSIC
jgi:transaldolase